MGKGKAILFPTVIFVAIFSITGWTDEPAKPDSVSDGDSSSSYADIEQQINELKKENAALESQETRLNAENSEIAGRIEERERIGFIIMRVQQFMNPARNISPVLANIGFIFGVTSLLLMLTGWPVFSRKVLSLRFLFAIPVRKSASGDTPPIGTIAKNNLDHYFYRSLCVTHVACCCTRHRRDRSIL